LGTGEHTTQMVVSSEAGKWEQALDVRVVVTVSAFRTFLKIWFPPLAWIAGYSVYGAIFGSILGLFSAVFSPQITEANTGLLLGALFGALIFIFPGIALGSLGKLSVRRGSDGAKEGAALGFASGIIAGALSGAFLQQVLPWLGMALGGFADVRVFGTLVGL
ncbi:MAG: hypothetical protein ACK2TV_15240, partial [Anaerolineales bacterium]